MRKVYFDHNATTPVHPEVAEAVQPFLGEMFGNPSSIHFAGREVRKAVEDAREEIAAFYGCRPLELIFTSSGTESDNLAIKGVAYLPGNEGKHIVTSQVEHPAIMNTCRFLESRGYRVTYVPVDRQGIVEPEAVRKAIGPDTMLVSVMAANNETGNVMPIAEIGAIAREAGGVDAYGRRPGHREDSAGLGEASGRPAYLLRAQDQRTEGLGGTDRPQGRGDFFRHPGGAPGDGLPRRDGERGRNRRDGKGVLPAPEEHGRRVGRGPAPPGRSRARDFRPDPRPGAERPPDAAVAQHAQRLLPPRGRGGAAVEPRHAGRRLLFRLRLHLGLARSVPGPPGDGRRPHGRPGSASLLPRVRERRRGRLLRHRRAGKGRGQAPGDVSSLPARKAGAK